MNEDLKQAFQQIFDDFGQDIINDKNLANIVADYYSFDRNPAVRNILKAIVNDGYAIKIGQLKTSKGDPSIDLERYANEIEQSWGYGKDQVRYVLSCIASSIGIEYKIDNSENQKKPSNLPPPQKRVINKPKTNNSPNVPVHNQLQPPTKLDFLFSWTSKIKYWHVFIFFLLFSVISGVDLVENDILILLYMLIVILLFVVSWAFFGFLNHLNEKILIMIVSTAFLLGMPGGLFGGYSFKKYRKERKEKEIEARVNDLINRRDTLVLSNYIRSSEFSTLEYWDHNKKKIENAYDSLKYVLTGCERIVNDMNAHTRVLKSYGFSDAGLKEMYTRDFYRILSALLDYQPNAGQSTRDYMLNKLIAYINYGHGIMSSNYDYHYPWNSKSYSNWKRFSFVESNNALLQCLGYGSTLAYDGIESFQVRLVKENDVWYIDDYIKSDGTSLKEIYTHYIKGQ